ncbi:MAG: hypothetical protein PHN77_18250 [Thermoguttaceae bacterium]|nr:hypothetical protein [Thermoguttaceae bacterium]
MYRTTVVRLPDRQPAVNLGQVAPAVVEVVIVLVIAGRGFRPADCPGRCPIDEIRRRRRMSRLADEFRRARIFAPESFRLRYI